MHFHLFHQPLGQLLVPSPQWPSLGPWQLWRPPASVPGAAGAPGGRAGTLRATGFFLLFYGEKLLMTSTNYFWLSFYSYLSWWWVDVVDVLRMSREEQLLRFLVPLWYVANRNWCYFYAISMCVCVKQINITFRIDPASDDDPRSAHAAAAMRWCREGRMMQLSSWVFVDGQWSSSFEWM